MLDTAAKTNITEYTEYILHQSGTDKRNLSEELQSTHHPIRRSSKTEMRSISNSVRYLALQLINLKVLPILGKDACEDLGLIEKIDSKHCECEPISRTKKHINRKG